MPAPPQITRLRASSAHELAVALERLIERGALASGATLPSVRSLATTTGLSPVTVAGAIGELRRRGRVVTHERRRTVVAERPSASATSVYVPSGAMDLAHGGPDLALLPDLRDAVTSALEESRELDAYAAPAMDPGLEAWWRAQWQAPCGVMAANGALDLVERALGSRLRVGDLVGVEDPGYPPTLRVLRALGVRPVPLALDAQGPTEGAVRNALREGISAIVVTPKGQNPTGSRMTRERADALAKLLRGVFIVEDDHLGPLGPPSVHLGRKSTHWIVTRSLSKAFGPDLRVALAAGDEETIAMMSERFQAGPGWVSHLLQRTARHLIEAPRTRTWLGAVSSTYDARRTALRSALTKHGIANQGESGYNVWIPVRDETSTCLALADAGYAVAPGAPYRLSSPPAIRVCAARLEPDQAERFAAALGGVDAAS